MTEAVRLLQKFMDSCLQQRSRDAMLSCVTEDICCAGIGAFASVSGRKELEHSFFSGMRQYPQPIFFSIGKTEEKELGGSILLSFSMQVQVGRSGPLSTLQGSMVACRENGALKITMLHVSEKEPPASAAGQYAQILGPLFPSYSVRTVHAVKEKGVALFSRMVPGGMMGGYVEKGFPLYFINDRLLEYLGYTYQEFIEDTKGYVINGIYPDDRIPVIRTVEQSFQHSKEYRVKYRMKKKDGSYIWVDDYGRFVTSEDGRPAIISVCIDITESVHLQEELEKNTKKLVEKNRELEQFYDTVFSGISKIMDDPGYTRVYANDRYYAMLGYGKGEHGQLEQMDRWDVIWEEDREELRRVLQKARDGIVASAKVRMRRKDGSYLWVKMDARLSDETSHGYRLFHCLYTNINGQSEAELAERRQRYYTSLLLTINSAGSMVVYCKDQYPFAYVGENLIRFLGYEKEEFHQRILNYIQLCYKPDVAAMSRSVESQLAQNDYYEVEYRVQRKDGTPVWVLEKGKRLQDMDGEDILVCVLLDHSRQRRVREHLWEKSVLDPLTQIYNRSAAKQEIEVYLEENPGNGAALLILDLDNFKQINDRYGHIQGDTVLIQTASVLSRSLRQEDIVARLGGDEFILFLKDIESGIDVEKRARGICKQMEQKLSEYVPGEHLTVSIGIALSESEETSFETLYQNADVALYRAKCKGKNTCEIYKGPS